MFCTSTHFPSLEWKQCFVGVMLLFDLRTFFFYIISSHVGIAQETDQKSSSSHKYKTTGGWSTLLYELSLQWSPIDYVQSLTGFKSKDPVGGLYVCIR